MPHDHGCSQSGFIPQEDFSQDPTVLVSFSQTGFLENHYEEVCDQLEVLHRTGSRNDLNMHLADAREDLKLAIATLQAADSKTSRLQDNISVLQSQHREAIETLKAKIEAMNTALANERAKTEALTNAIQGLEGSLQAERAGKEEIQAQAHTETQRLLEKFDADKKHIMSQLDQARFDKQQVSLKLEDLRRRSGYLEPRPNNSIWIMLICFGDTYITDEKVVDKCYELAHSKQTFQFNPAWSNGIDPMPGVVKNVTILYRYNNTGSIRCLHSLEHKDVRFDLK